MNKNVLKSAFRLLLAVAMGLVYGWFVLSFKWSLDEMGFWERCAGVVYFLTAVPVYYGLTADK